MKISIVYVTYRPGGFDMLVDSLRNQTVQDYELIVIDDYNGNREDVVREYLIDQGVNLKYIGRSKPKCFPDSWYNFVNSLNTGVLASTGDVILLMQDYSWLDPNCLERWVQHESLFKQKCCIAGVGKYWRVKPENTVKDLSDPISIWKTDWHGHPAKNGWTDSKMWIGDPLELFYVAIPYDLLMETNGFPEWVDYVYTCFVLVEVFVEQLNKIGARIHTDADNVCHMLNHKLWKPRTTWHTLASKREGILIYNEEALSQNIREAMVKAMQGRPVPRWWQWQPATKDWSMAVPAKSQEPNRPNCFDLKNHVRGELYWKEKR